MEKKKSWILNWFQFEIIIFLYGENRKVKRVLQTKLFFVVIGIMPFEGNKMKYVIINAILIKYAAFFTNSMFL